MATGRGAERELEQRTLSISRAAASGSGLGSEEIPDVLLPDKYEVEMESGSDAFLETGIRALMISDETGKLVDWPWETGPTGRHTGGKRRRHRLDDTIMLGLMHSTAKGDMGEGSTGVRRWKSFCAAYGKSPHRPMDATAPLWARLEEEWLVMRFVSALADDALLAINTCASYVGQVQGWHARAHGVKLAAGMKLGRLADMMKGLRRLRGEGARAVRRGIAPHRLQAAMNVVFNDPSNAVHANMRAALSLALQGLLRGAEFSVDGAGKFNPCKSMTRNDLVCLTEGRLVVMMRPCKNMQYLGGKTVPLVIGAGGAYVDAVREMRNLLRVDPVSSREAATTSMFRQPSVARPGEWEPLTTATVRHWTRQLMQAIGEDASQFGAHSYRIGGATALFTAGANEMVIRTMGRWSSDCYRLYVRACFDQTLDWSKRCGSQVVSDVAGEFAEVDCY